MPETARELDAVLDRLLAGALPVEEIVCEILDLIEDEGATEAFDAVWADQLLGEAKGLDRRAKEGEPHGLLHGVPFAVDGAVSVAKGMDELGAQRVRDTGRGRDAALLQPLRAAGALVLGRSGDGPLAQWQSLPGVLGVPRDSLRGGHYAPTRGLVSNVGLSVRRPSFDVPALTAASLDLIARCAAVLGISVYPGDGSSPQLFTTAGALPSLPQLKLDEVDLLDEESASQWREASARVLAHEERAASVELEPGAPGSEIREAYDVFDRLRSELEQLLADGGVLIAADEGLPWQTLGLPTVRSAGVTAVGRRFEDGEVLAAARALASTADPLGE